MYTSIHQFEPLLPGQTRQGELLEMAHGVVQRAMRVVAQPVPPDLRHLLREMNSYYTNRIEGQHTRPRDIERALRQDFSADQGLARKQRLAVAHIDAEQAVEARYADAGSVAALYQPEAVTHLHEALFQPLPPQDLLTDEGEIIVPGEMRSKEVQVGRHVAPSSASVPAFLARWSQAYATVRRGELQLVAAAAAHQRLGWIHPFVDGNGRVMRLHTHAVLTAMGYTGGLWSPLRGFARSTDRYYALLEDADSLRRGDLDGRGNLSEQALAAWIAYVLDICLDQATFMAAMLDLGTMRDRIAACLAFEEQGLKSGVRSEALHALHYLFLSGTDLERGTFKTMLGLGERTSGTVLSALIKRGFLKSDTPQGKIRFGIPHHALRFYFPALWPEAEIDAAP